MLVYMSTKPLLDTWDLASRYKIPTWTIRRRIRSGTLPAADRTIGNSQVWYLRTILEFEQQQLASRP